MFHHIEKLQRMQRRKRKTIALITTILFFVVVILIWFLTFNILNIKKSPKKNFTDEWTSLSEVIKSSLNDFKEVAK